MVTYVICQSEKLTLGGADQLAGAARSLGSPGASAARPTALTLAGALDTVTSVLGLSARSSMLNVRMRLALLFAVLVATFALTGCAGHTEEEWQAAQRDIAKLKADLDASAKRHTDDEQKYADAEQQIEDLKAKLKDLGVGLSKSEEEKAKLRTAMAEYQARLKQLDDMKARFRDLKARLDKLTGAGLNVLIRHNKMVIQLPGDVLFDSGRDSLKPEGKKILKQVADIIKSDTTLS